MWRGRCEQIREEIEQYGINIYQFPDCDSDEDEDFKQQDQELKVSEADGPNGAAAVLHFMLCTTSLSHHHHHSTGGGRLLKRVLGLIILSTGTCM